ncbi:bax Inhibitor family protein [Coprinopsis cinerea okayama7|uniref:Bax Inhibitor family protein n=1 Tax=Coprinopsis cinerea (strain Okayama-7 / 130 / ATCC MYA-4618 / FGSC 9003) TaxID=240176 RepID=A8N382_COPC7|nr:bax Inhibitor family protein [Coprinopsis cinerea okayama7\|eukprot:XP_001829327.2 bax Inhibitor family protein [Coprinopsis cinerea okayama7\
MQRLPLATLKTLASSTTSSSLRPTSRIFTNHSLGTSTKSFSTFRPGNGGVLNALREQRAKWGAATGIVTRAARRGFQTDTQPIVQKTEFSWQRFAVTAAGVAGTAVVVNAIFNRETRDALSAGEREYLNSSFKYTGAGVLLTAAAARAMFRGGFTFRLMAANPWVVLGVSLVGSIGTMMGVYYTPPEKTVQKHLLWLAFNGFQAATLSPLFFFSPAILSRAALYTVGVIGSLSYIGATAKSDKYLYLGGPLLAGVTVVALSSLAPMVLPLGLRGLAISEAISLYGGLAVFGGFVLYDTQKILHHARLVERGAMKSDPIKESIALELDFINIFIRLVQILAMQGNRKK